MNFMYHDGGRTAAGYRGNAGDCVPRAIAIATGKPYLDVYRDLSALNELAGGPASARDGTPRKIIDAYLKHLGWEWTPTMHIGSGCRVHLRTDELPPGRLIARLSRHTVAVVTGTVFDITDPRRGGTRCVYGYWSPAVEAWARETGRFR